MRELTKIFDILECISLVESEILSEGIKAKEYRDKRDFSGFEDSVQRANYLNGKLDAYKSLLYLSNNTIDSSEFIKLLIGVSTIRHWYESYCDELRDLKEKGLTSLEVNQEIKIKESIVEILESLLVLFEYDKDSDFVSNSISTTLKHSIETIRRQDLHIQSQENEIKELKTALEALMTHCRNSITRTDGTVLFWEQGGAGDYEVVITSPELTHYLCEYHGWPNPLDLTE